MAAKVPTPKSRPWRDRQTLESYYWETSMSIDEIANELGCSKPTLYKHLVETFGLRDPYRETPKSPTITDYTD